MPFTFSHPAAILPLAYIPKRYISVTGLVIGSITPDFEYFIRMQHYKTVSHTWDGMFWFDLPIGLFLVFLFNLLVRDALIDNIPPFLNQRFSRYKTTSKEGDIQTNITIIIISLLLGIFSHLVWDRLTHKTVDIVEEHYKDFYSTFWDANSIIGAALIAFAIYKLPKKTKTNRMNIMPFWIVVFTVAGSVALLYVPYAYKKLDFAVPFISGCILGLIIASLCDYALSFYLQKLIQSEKE